VAILTGLAPDPRQPGYRLVLVDRGRFASLPDDALAPLDLQVGAELSPAALERLQHLADVTAAEGAALRALARRVYARADLERRLARKRHPRAAVAGALERLAARGLIDDRRFAEEYARARAARGSGPARIVRDLLTQGVERRMAEEAVRRALELEAIDPEIAARTLAVRRARQLGDLAPAVKRRRLLAFLLRRGYPGPQVRELVEELAGGPG
jgi:regulatory protein